MMMTNKKMVIKIQTRNNIMMILKQTTMTMAISFLLQGDGAGAAVGADHDNRASAAASAA